MNFKQNWSDSFFSNKKQNEANAFIFIEWEKINDYNFFFLRYFHQFLYIHSNLF